MSATQTIKVADVKVRDGFNVRQNGGGIEELAESVKLLGVLQPIILDADRYLVAGHRRLAAARLAGLEEIPWVAESSGEEKGRVAAMAAENIARQNLSPAEEAEAIDRLLKAGFTAAGCAQALGMSKQLVTRRQTLLRIPEDLRALWGPAGTARLDAAPYVAAIVEKVPRLAPVMLHAHRAWEKGAADPAANGWNDPPSVDDLLEGRGKRPERYLDALYQLYGDRRSAPKWPGDFVFFVENERIDSRDLEIAQLKVPSRVKQRHAAARDKLRAAYIWGVDMAVAEADVDAARAAGVTVKFPDGPEVIHDAAWMRDRIETELLPRFEREADQRIKGQKSAASRASGKTASGDLTPAEKKRREQEQRQREAEKKWKGLAPGANLDLGAALLKAFGEVKLDADTARFFAESSLGPRKGNGYDYGSRPAARLAAAGLRYVMPGWQTHVPKPTKADPNKTVVEYLAVDEAEKKLWAWFDQASKPGEILGRALIIHAAARWAVENAVPRSQRSMSGHSKGYCSRFETDSSNARRALEKLTKSVLPASVSKLIREIENFDPARA